MTPATAPRVAPDPTCLLHLTMLDAASGLVEMTVKPVFRDDADDWICAYDIGDIVVKVAVARNGRVVTFLGDVDHGDINAKAADRWNVLQSRLA